jgi:hypothetical protein
LKAQRSPLASWALVAHWLRLLLEPASLWAALVRLLAWVAVLAFLLVLVALLV